jgi:hypothetical protein
MAVLEIPSGEEETREQSILIRGKERHLQNK